MHSKKIIGSLEVIIANFCFAFVGTSLNIYKLDSFLNTTLTFSIFTLVSMVVILYRHLDKYYDKHNIENPLSKTFDFKIWIISLLNFLRLLFLYISFADGMPGISCSLYLLFPAFVVLINKFYFHKNVDNKILIGVLISFVGVIVLNHNAIKKVINMGYNIKELKFILPILSALFWAIIILFYKNNNEKLDKYDDLYLQFTPITIIAIIIFLLSLYNKSFNNILNKFELGISNISIKNVIIMSMFFLTILFTGYILFDSANEKLNSIETSVLSVCLPIFGFILGYFMLGNKITIYHIIGAILIVCGSFYVSLNVSMDSNSEKLHKKMI